TIPISTAHREAERHPGPAQREQWQQRQRLTGEDRESPDDSDPQRPGWPWRLDPGRGRAEREQQQRSRERLLDQDARASDQQWIERRDPSRGAPDRAAEGGGAEPRHQDAG